MNIFDGPDLERQARRFRQETRTPARRTRRTLLCLHGYWSRRHTGLPLCGHPPIDPKSDGPNFQTEDTRRFRRDPPAQAGLANAAKLSSVSAGDSDAVFYVGGHGVRDVAEDAASIKLIEAMIAADKPVSPVCHGSAVFRHPKAGRDAACSRKEGRRI